MEHSITLLQFIISVVTIVGATVIGVVRFVAAHTDKAKKELRREMAVVQEELTKKIEDVKESHSETHRELAHINTVLVEIRTLLFGALGQPGMLTKKDSHQS